MLCQSGVTFSGMFLELAEKLHVVFCLLIKLVRFAIKIAFRPLLEKGGEGYHRIGRV